MKALPAALLLLAGCATAPRPLSEEQLATYPEARGMPSDVQDFIVRYRDCEHWLGEPDYDEARRREIARAVAETCPGIDAYGGRIRARYSANAEVLARLRDFEPIGQ